jgi:hypothetical protein
MMSMTESDSIDQTYGYIGVKVEKYEKNEPERKGNPDILARQIPEPNKPFPVSCGLESGIRGQPHSLDVHIGVEASPVGKARDRDDRDGHAVVGAESPNVTM